MKSSTEGIKKSLSYYAKQNSKTPEQIKRIIRHGDSRRFVAGNSVSGFQGYCFINEAGMFLTSVEMFVDWKRQDLRSTQPCFSTCLTIKGSECHKVTVFQPKRYKSVSLRMWTPKKSVVVKPPDLEVKGTCIVHDINKNRARETTDPIALSESVFPEEHSSNWADHKEVSREQGDRTADKDGGDGNEGKLLLALLESSLKKKLNPEYIDIIPSRLNRLTGGYKSPQFGESSTSYFRSLQQAIKQERLPMELRFGIQNPKKFNLNAVLGRPRAVERPKTVACFYRGKLEPLLPRKKPAENLHKELEREETRARRETQCK